MEITPDAGPPAEKGMQAILQETKPQEAYFTEIDGARHAILIVHTNEVAELPAIAEPRFLQLDEPFGACQQVEKVWQKCFGRIAPAQWESLRDMRGFLHLRQSALSLSFGVQILEHIAMLHEIQNGYVKTETHYGVTTIEFYHPQSNSLPGKILFGLAQEIHAAAGDADTRVIVLRSGGERAFCAGASFDELLAIKNEKEGYAFFSGFAHVINEMRKCSKFIVIRVQGKCVGGGVGLVAAADYALAVEGAEIKLSELAIGIGPFVVGPAVERKIGLSAFSQLAIDAGMWRNADWARRKGLFAEVHNEAAGMDESLHRLTETLAHANPEAVHEMKKIFWNGTEHWEQLLFDRAMVSGKLILSPQSRAALEQFKKK